VIRAAALCGGLLAAVPALAAGPHPDLTIGVSSFPSTLHPAIDPDLIKFFVLGFADRPVTVFDASGRLVCLLCTEVPSIANGDAKLEALAGGKQGMAVTFHFKPDLQWGDGAPLGAADLAFTARVGRDPNSGFANTHTWEIVSRVDVLDAHTAVVHYTEPNYQFDQLSELPPEHLDAAVFDRASGPGQYMQQSFYSREPTNPGLYNGPYLVTGYDTGTRVVLERNPHWQGRRPYFDRVIIKTIGNTAALQTNLLSGDVDMIPGEGVGLTLDQVLTLRRQYPDRFQYIFKPGLAYDHIDLDLSNRVLTDVRVRRALLLALDRATMSQKLFDGLQPVADSWVSPLDPVHASDLPTYPYDPARAAALLDEAGWKPGPDGVRRNAAGEKLSLVFGTSAGNRLRELMQQVFQSDWRRVGIETVIHNEPPRTFFGETLSHRAFKGMALYAWVMDISGPPRQMLGSDQIPSAANNWSGGNYMGWRDARVDADIHVAETELDAGKRQAAWAEMQRIYASELPVLPLFFRVEPHVVPKWLKGYAPTGHNDFGTLWGEEWHAE
jgi:peptide/nickel transport system substrate-binding protein